MLGYAGIVTLGHAAFFGTGAYTAGHPRRAWLGRADHRAPRRGAWPPRVIGFLTGLVILRTTGLTLLMQTLVVATLLQRGREQGDRDHRRRRRAAGHGGLADLRLFRFDLFGRTAYVYCLAVLFLGWLAARRLVHSPFGRSLTGIRENVARMHAIGAPVVRRRLVVYTISAALAGVAGALIAQTTQFVGARLRSASSAPAPC